MKKGKFILLFLGLVFLGVGLFMGYQEWRVIAGAEKAIGEIADAKYVRTKKGSDMYQAVVRFTARTGQSITYTSSLSTSVKPSIGKKVEIFYRPEQPEIARINSFTELYLFPFVFGGSGIVLLALGFMSWYLVYARKNRLVFLKSHGYEIPATVTKIFYNRTFRVNGRSPYKIYATGTHPVSAVPTEFISHNIWVSDLPKVLGERKQITVYMDRNNPKKYVFDVDFLPPENI